MWACYCTFVNVVDPDRIVWELKYCLSRVLSQTVLDPQYWLLSICKLVFWEHPMFLVIVDVFPIRYYILLFYSIDLAKVDTTVSILIITKKFETKIFTKIKCALPAQKFLRTPVLNMIDCSAWSLPTKILCDVLRIIFQHLA